jgi:hypothetical protein
MHFSSFHIILHWWMMIERLIIYFFLCCCSCCFPSFSKHQISIDIFMIFFLSFFLKKCVFLLSHSNAEILHVLRILPGT